MRAPTGRSLSCAQFVTQENLAVRKWPLETQTDNNLAACVRCLNLFVSVLNLICFKNLIDVGLYGASVNLVRQPNEIIVNRVYEYQTGATGKAQAGQHLTQDRSRLRNDSSEYPAAHELRRKVPPLIATSSVENRVVLALQRAWIAFPIVKYTGCAERRDEFEIVRSTNPMSLCAQCDRDLHSEVANATTRTRDQDTRTLLYATLVTESLESSLSGERGRGSMVGIQRFRGMRNLGRVQNRVIRHDTARKPICHSKYSLANRVSVHPITDLGNGSGKIKTSNSRQGIARQCVAKSSAAQQAVLGIHAAGCHPHNDLIRTAMRPRPVVHPFKNIRFSELSVNTGAHDRTLSGRRFGDNRCRMPLTGLP